MPPAAHASRASRHARGRIGAFVALAAGWLLGMAGTLPAAAPAVGPSGLDHPRVRFIAIASLDSLAFVGPGAWSPRGQRLALRCSTGTLYVFDAARPTLPPRLVLRTDHEIQSCSWSPDGSWLAAVVGDSLPGKPAVIAAVAATGGTPVVMIQGRGIRPVAWGCDGRVYCWTERRRHAMDPPAGWARPASLPRLDPAVVEVAEDLSLRMRRWAPQEGEDLMLLGIDMRSRAGIRLTVLDLLPNQSRALVGVSRDTASRWLVVGSDGRTITDLHRQGIAFQPSSLSGDGRQVAGFLGRWERGLGWQNTSLRIADAGGAWVAPIEEAAAGFSPQLSRVGSLIAFTDMRTGATHIGRLAIQPR
jgi:WD40 repeat protein